MLVPDSSPSLARPSFELARRGFARHLAVGRLAERDPRYLEELHALALAWRPHFAGTPDVHDAELARMRERILDVQRARSVRSLAAEELIEVTMRRVVRVRRWILAPQTVVTRRPSLIQRVLDTLTDVTRFAQAEPGRFEAQLAAVRELRETLELSLSRTREARAALDAVTFTNALADELRTAIEVALAHESAGQRVMALDRVLEAHRQLVLSAAEPRAMVMTQAALKITRARGLYEPKQVSKKS